MFFIEGQIKMNVAVIGYGSIGKALVDLLDQHPTHTVAAILVRPHHLSKHPKMTTDFQQICNDLSIDTIIEVINDPDVAFNLNKKAMLAHKNVITANKACMIKYGLKLYELSKQQQVSFAFSATCGGGIPILNQICEHKDKNFKEMIGILNGTTNYMLDQISNNHVDYQQALKQAQDFGYAELDPTADVSGSDVSNKLRIASAVGFNQWLEADNVLVEGIQHLSLKDFDVFEKSEKTIRLLGSLRKEKHQIAATVVPVAIKKDSFFGSCLANKNHILLVGDGEPVKMIGYGAGGIETSANIILDLDKISHSRFSHFSDSISTSQPNQLSLNDDWIIQTDQPDDQLHQLATSITTDKTNQYTFINKSVEWMFALIKEVRKTKRASLVCVRDNL